MYVKVERARFKRATSLITRCPLLRRVATAKHCLKRSIGDNQFGLMDGGVTRDSHVRAAAVCASCNQTPNTDRMSRRMVGITPAEYEWRLLSSFRDLLAVFFDP